MTSPSTSRPTLRATAPVAVVVAVLNTAVLGFAAMFGLVTFFNPIAR